MRIKKSNLFIFIIVLVIILAVVIFSINLENENTIVKLETTEGDITIELYSAEMPITAGNFESLVDEGFYDGVVFHRVIDSFMIQSGDPTGTGRGGPGYTIEDEFVEGFSNERGTISMANSGPNSGGSQFFINLQDNAFLDWDKQPLTSRHPVFGKVIDGMDVVDSIGRTETDGNDRPIQEIRILSARIL